MRNQNHMDLRRGIYHKSKRNMCREKMGLKSYITMFIINIFSWCILFGGVIHLNNVIPSLEKYEEEKTVIYQEDVSSKFPDVNVKQLKATETKINTGTSNLVCQIANEARKKVDMRGITKSMVKAVDTLPTPEDLINELSFDEEGVVTANVLNMRSEPSTESEIMGIMTYNKQVSYSTINDEWAAVKSLNEDNEEEVYFINLKYITDEELPYEFKEVSGDKRKSFEDYRKITLTTSKQYRIQQRYAYTDEETGIRVVDGKYCIGLGSYFTHNIGQYVDLVLANGEVIPCVIGDAKNNLHTNENNSIGLDGSVAEFIVDKDYLDRHVKSSGNISNVKPEWNSEVIGVRLYDKSLLH